MVLGLLTEGSQIDCAFIDRDAGELPLKIGDFLDDYVLHVIAWLVMIDDGGDEMIVFFTVGRVNGESFGTESVFAGILVKQAPLFSGESAPCDSGTVDPVGVNLCF